MRDLANRRLWLEQRKRQISDRIRLAKSRPCMDCALEFESSLMELDHISSKTLSIANAWKRSWSMARLESEIALCEVVCIGCHRIRTYNRRQCTTSSQKPRILTGVQWKCIRCGETKDKALFSYSHGRIERCLECESKRSMQKKLALRASVDTLKLKPCSDCGESHGPLLMDFHHIDPSTKSFGIGEAVRDGRKLSVILEEIAKCILICCWCHARMDHRASMAA
jgi:hypothetical protein